MYANPFTMHSILIISGEDLSSVVGFGVQVLYAVLNVCVVDKSFAQ